MTSARGVAAIRVALGTLAIGAMVAPSSAVVFIRDGFGDADINNNGIPLEVVDTNIAGTPPMGLPDTYVPARLEDAMGDGPANQEVTTVLNSSDRGIRWLQTRGFTGGSSTAAGAGASKPTIRIIDDTQGAQLETQSGVTGGLGGQAIDSGYAMAWNSRGGGSSAAGFFDTQVQLGPEPGDEIKVSFDFRIWRDTPDANTNLVPNLGELRFGLFQDTDNQLGTVNPFAGRQMDIDNDGFDDDIPAVWGQDEGLFEGSLTGNRGPGDDVGTNGDAGWTVGVLTGNAAPADIGLTRIREEVQADRVLQGQDTQTIARPENRNPDPFGVPDFDFIALDNERVYNLALSLVRDTIETAGDTITATFTITDKRTNETWELSGTEGIDGEDGGPQSDSWDYFMLRNASSGPDEFDFLLDNFALEVNGSNSIIPGDFNEDGRVNAADYTVWRDGLGTTFDQSDYDTWVDNFGSVLFDDAGSSAAVPEPVSAIMAAAFAVAALARRPRYTVRPRR